MEKPSSEQLNSIALPEGKTKRLELIDLLRGLTLVSMIAYHAAWDLVYMFGVNWPFYRSLGGYLWQQSICWSFILLSGFCMTLGANPFKRGLFVFLCGALISLVTWSFMPQNLVLFGILTFLGSAMLIGGMLLKPAGKLAPRAAMSFGLLSFCLFLSTKLVNTGLLFTWIRLPQALYANLLTAYLGFPPPGFYSTDYFSLIPWLFLFLAGMCFGLALGKRGKKMLEHAPLPALRFLGRHSLLFYMLHQPVLYLLFTAIFSRAS